MGTGKKTKGEIRIKYNSIYPISTCMYMYLYDKKERRTKGVVAAVEIKRSRYTECTLWIWRHRKRAESRERDPILA
jgi:hypothetical protein